MDRSMDQRGGSPMIGSFESHTLSGAGVTLAYEVHGHGDRTFVYLHGLLLDAAVNRRLADDLAGAGNRVILLDLPGHGASSKPLHAAAHRMDAYALHLLRLLDHLDVGRAILGGVSLGADVTLMAATMAPERVAGMVIEMPVLEQATPFAAMLFTPLLAAAHYAAPVFRTVSSLARRLPRRRLGPLDQVIGPLTLDPAEMAAVLHGVLVGPVGPTAEQRTALSMPALVIGHRSDRLHPFGDASRLARQLPRARLLQAHSIFELRLHPGRLTAEIADFCDQVWSEHSTVNRRDAARRGGAA